MTKKRIVIDCDPGIDDALAIILALKHPEIQVDALTTVTGNTVIDNTTVNALKTLKLCDREDIPVYRGCGKSLLEVVPRTASVHGSDGLGGYGHLIKETAKEQDEHAVDFLIRYARENSGEFTLFIVGPCTNIAQAVRKDPEFVNHVKEVIIMGGGKGVGNATPVAEFNFWADALAAKEVFEAGFKEVTMVGLNVTNTVSLEADVREMIRIFDTDLSRFIYDMSRKNVDLYWKYYGRPISSMHDVLTIGYLIDREILEVVPAHIEVVDSGPAIGESIVDVNGRYHDGQCNAKYAAEVDANRFNLLFLTTVFPEHAETIKEYFAKYKN